MEPTRTDRDLGGDTLTAYDFAMEEIGVASSKLARALLARALARGAMPDRECAEAQRVYDKMIDLYPRVRLDATQRASLLEALALLRSRLEECDAGRKTRQSKRVR